MAIRRLLTITKTRPDDIDYICAHANAAPLKAAGLDLDDVIGKPFEKTWWWSYDGAVQDRLRDAIGRAAMGEIVNEDSQQALVHRSRTLGDHRREIQVHEPGLRTALRDQIPRRAVDSGLIGEYGLIDPSDRGSSSRYSLSAETHRGDSDSLTRISGYLLSYDLSLFSNFTYFLDNPDDGDQFEQMDERVVAGFEASRTWLRSWGGRGVETSAGTPGA
ncbi:MAG: hypothetical protein HC882_07120, partial [Acidobacteria bacterium]|nr:hypothetical protein [Acidobacteriota bacterium]